MHWALIGNQGIWLAGKSFPGTAARHAHLYLMPLHAGLMLGT